MKTSILKNTIFLIAATIGVFIWTISPTLTSYTLQLTGILVLLYLITNRLEKKHSIIKKTAITIDLTILTTIVLLLITTTDGLASPFFFMIYFLLFATSMLFETTSTLILTAVIFVFFVSHPTSDFTSLTHLTELIAVIMIAPLAILTSHQHEELLRTQKTARNLTSNIKNQETSALLFLSLNLKNTLTKTLDTLSLVIPQITNTAQQLWEIVGRKGEASASEWPSMNEKDVEESMVTIAVQVNGKLRATIIAELCLVQMETLLALRLLHDHSISSDHSLSTNSRVPSLLQY